MGTAEGSGDAGAAAELAGERVREIVAAAEQAATAIVADAETEARRIRAAAEAEADEIRSAARAESDQQVEAASREASGRIEQARGAVEGLVAQADRLRAQVGALGRDLAASVPGAPGREGDTEAGAVDDGTSGTDQNPEPAGATGSAEAVVAATEPAATEAADEPAASDAPVEPAAAAPHPGAGGEEEARLIAMSMALDGASREEIAGRVRSEVGRLDGLDALVDDVLSRAGR
jgi:hypothetical protein